MVKREGTPFHPSSTERGEGRIERQHSNLPAASWAYSGPAFSATWKKRSRISAFSVSFTPYTLARHLTPAAGIPESTSRAFRKTTGGSALGSSLREQTQPTFLGR